MPNIQLVYICLHIALFLWKYPNCIVSAERKTVTCLMPTPHLNMQNKVKYLQNKVKYLQNKVKNCTL